MTGSRSSRSRACAREVAEVVRRELDLPASGVRSSGVAITPALLARMSSEPSHALTNVATESRSARSNGAAKTCLLAVPAVISRAVLSPASRLRTARVRAAPAPASARESRWGFEMRRRSRSRACRLGRFPRSPRRRGLEAEGGGERVRSGMADGSYRGLSPTRQVGPASEPGVESLLRGWSVRGGP
jgi:hypothetical protein